jgi:hypothetical protein
LFGGLLRRKLAVAFVGSGHGELGRATLLQRVSVTRLKAGNAASTTPKGWPKWCGVYYLRACRSECAVLEAESWQEGWMASVAARWRTVEQALDWRELQGWSCCGGLSQFW